jgi:hypothetical protein
MTPSDERASALRRLAAQIRADISDIERVAADLGTNLDGLSAEAASVLECYGVGKLVHDFYTAAERSFSRIASELGGLPRGERWHRELLSDMALDIPKLRPPVLRRETRESLDGFLRFRHVFRNLYAFNLQWEKVRALAEEVPEAWLELRADLESFASSLDRIAADLES